ncbi:coiled-coil domain-containing protein 115 isoform X2 [Pezoporus occidentalis]|uniref:coiled-coil domain-containing protein 115 isoform X2 n=1 Tax=Pezoporus occidentalis TaxID=407982 RepID=UPI002F91795D
MREAAKASMPRLPAHSDWLQGRRGRLLLAEAAARGGTESGSNPASLRADWLQGRRGRLPLAEAMAGLGAELDAEALALMEALEALQERRQSLERVLREARYSLGCHRVSALQYGATMEPRVRVLPRQDPGAPPRFEEVPGSGGDPEDPQEGEGKGLRQRRGPPEKGGAPPRPPPDPLTWFGVLVPLPLRRAQGSFSQAVSLALDVAALQSAVAAAAARYRALLGGQRRPRADTEGSAGSRDELELHEDPVGNVEPVCG